MSTKAALHACSSNSSAAFSSRARQGSSVLSHSTGRQCFRGRAPNGCFFGVQEPGKGVSGRFVLPQAKARTAAQIAVTSRSFNRATRSAVLRVQAHPLVYSFANFAALAPAHPVNAAGSAGITDAASWAVFHVPTAGVHDQQRSVGRFEHIRRMKIRMRVPQNPPPLRERGAVSTQIVAHDLARVVFSYEKLSRHSAGNPVVRRRVSPL